MHQRGDWILINSGEGYDERGVPISMGEIKRPRSSFKKCILLELGDGGEEGSAKLQLS